MNNNKDDDALSSLSDSSQKNDAKIEAKNQNKSSSNSKKEKGQKRLVEVQAIWAEHEKWLRNSAYSQPQVVENIFPQFFADIKNESNLQMAQVFCLPLVSMTANTPSGKPIHSSQWLIEAAQTKKRPTPSR